MSEDVEATPQEVADLAVSELSLESPSAVEDFVHLQIKSKLRGSHPAARAARAQLRSALGKEVGSVPAIWKYTLDGSDDRSRASMDAQSDDITPGERAAHAALTLWAFHQGSHTTEMHRRWKRPRSLGTAVRRLALADRGSRERDEDHPAYKRLGSVIAAPTFEALEYHVRGLIGQLRAAEIPIDYGRFASDLVKWQNPRLRSSVLRQWGRDFARTPKPDESEDHN